MKLELYHLAPYLPYQLRFVSEMDMPYDAFEKNPIWILDGVSELFGDYCLLTRQNRDAYAIHLCKPLLRPLSDLTREIEHKGERFVPVDYLSTYGKHGHQMVKTFATSKESWNHYEIEYASLIQLIEWHFDVFGLLDSGLAHPLNPETK